MRSGPVPLSILAIAFTAMAGLAVSPCDAVPAPDLDGAAWIWTPDAAGLNADQCTRYFRGKFTLPAGAEGGIAQITATADNYLTVYLNGTRILSRMKDPDGWDRPLTTEISGLLLPGTNCIAVEGVNTLAGPAGIIVKLSLAGGSGIPIVVVTDALWRGSDREAPGWQRPGFDDSGWDPVTVHGEFGMPPWGDMGLPKSTVPALDFEGAKWIWTQEAAKGMHLPAGPRYFRTVIDVPEMAAGARAQALITADNAFALYVNGTRIGRGSEWSQPARFDLTKVLTPGQNTIAVRALNTLEGAAALIARIAVVQPGADPLFWSTGEDWVCSHEAPEGWQRPGFDQAAWEPARVLGDSKMGPWGGALQIPPAAQGVLSLPVPRLTDYTDPVHEGAIVFVQGLFMMGSRGENFIQNISGTRAYTEFDTASPAALGRRLCTYGPMRPGGALRVLCDAKGGVLGSPAVSYDGRTVYFAMAPEGDPYFHVFEVGIDGTGLRQVTSGAFHDFDPEPLPDGRIAFSSTRTGSAEEYHGVAAFSLFSCNAQGADIRRITSHIVADREPRVCSDGSLAFIRCDNFLERAKVETHIHQVRPDGTGGRIIIGPDRAPMTWDRFTGGESNSAWLRVFGAGVPAPLPGGFVAAVSEQGVVLSANQRGRKTGSYLPYDFSPLPDGRLVCTDRDNWRVCLLDPKAGLATEILDGDDLRLADESGADLGMVSDAVHSVVYAGPRPVPPAIPDMVSTPEGSRATGIPTGFLYCQNARNTRHRSADISRIRAVRIYEGKPFVLAPTRSIYMHIGTEARELGTVPLGEDGSFYVEVPADRALSMQAVDGEGRAVISELSWVYVRPGERRSCVGCHAQTGLAPRAVRPKATAGRPLRLVDDTEPHRFRANNGANGGVLNLQLDRFREAGSINLHRQAALTAADATALPSGRQLDQADLLARVQHTDPAERIAAANRLAVLRDGNAVPDLVGLLRDDTPDVRVAAAMALSACGNKRALLPLAEAVADPHPMVTCASRSALEHLTAQSFADGGTSADWRVWIRNLDWDGYERNLCARLASPERLEVWKAVEALGHVGTKAAGDALAAWIDAHPDAELRVLMAALRALGNCGDAGHIPGLTVILHANLAPVDLPGDREAGFNQRPVYVAATAAEAMGRIGGPEAEAALIDAFGKLAIFEEYTLRCGDHPWLMGCHSSPVHYRILEALDGMGSTATGRIVPAVLRSVPMDKDRALLFEFDSYEALTSRVIQRSGRASEVIETCLAWLGDPEAARVDDLDIPASQSPFAESHIRPHTPVARAAQILSVVCLDPAYAPRISAVVNDYLRRPVSEERSWVCFMLLRSLARLKGPDAAECALQVLREEPAEAEYGYNAPPNHWVFKAMNPFFRAAAVYALGEAGESSSVPLLRQLLADFGNAPTVRHEAAVALGKVTPRDGLPDLAGIAADYPDFATRRALLEACAEVGRR